MKYVRARTRLTPPRPIQQTGRQARKSPMPRGLKSSLIMSAEYSANNLTNKRPKNSHAVIRAADGDRRGGVACVDYFVISPPRQRHTNRIYVLAAIFDWLLILMTMMMMLEAPMSCAGHSEVARVSSMAKLITSPTRPLLPYTAASSPHPRRYDAAGSSNLHQSGFIASLS